MEVPGADSDWRSPQFRQKVVAQIEEAMRKAGTPHTKSSTEMENHVYMKAKSREEYLSLVARLIIHFRDIHKKPLSGPDPMNALTNLTGVGGGPGAIGMGPRPTGAPVGGMGAMGPMQIGQHAMAGVSGNPQAIGGQMPMQQMVPQQSIQFQHFQQQQQQQQFQQQMRAQQQQQQMQQHHPNQQLQNQQLQNQQLQNQQLQNQQLQNQQQQNQMHQSRLQQQQMVQLQLQQQQQQQQQQQSLQHLVQQQQSGQMPPHSQQQQQQMTAAPHVPILSLSQQQQQQHLNLQAQARAALQQQQQQQQQQAAQLSAAAGPGQMVRHVHVSARMPRPAMPNTGAASAPGAPPIPQQVQQQHQMLSSPSPVQTTPSMPPPPQPSPQPPGSQPNSVSSGPAPSPGGFQPSPSPQPAQSPITARTPQNYGVPSPGPLNTPGNPGSVLSPSGSSLEDQQYMEKLKQLSKYIEPLSRMINKIDKNEDRKKDLSKMKSLLNILTDPNIRCPLKTLQKCEIALEKLKNDMAVPTPPPLPVPKQQYLCQPLLDAVMANIRSPVFNHSLFRTFSPAMSAIHGPPITGPSVTGRKRKLEEDERQTIPNVLQGEVARLDVKFLVNLDPSHCSNTGAVHLLCKLDDRDLPSVPPLQLSIPADYPDQSPHWNHETDDYSANGFLQTVHDNMASKLLQLPNKHSLTEVLNTWVRSVRQACLSAA
ncbi:LOW QUALITY PROTEIN: mediator of RNA polymerase II transcription subunit 15 [Synchiropus picturatus]